MRLDRVICRLDGGLGNQLFQYAAARALADRLGCGLALDLRALAPGAQRDFGLGAFAIRAEVAGADELAALPPARSSRAGRLRSALSLRLPGLAPYPVFWPRSFAFDARLLALREPKYLVGYWQSERYFDGDRERLLADLQVRAALPLEPGLLRQVRQANSVAVHIRRGDYVSDAAAARVHGVCEPDYYRRAVDWLVSQVADVHLFVFSDDLAWARAQFDFGRPTVFVEGGAQDSPLHDFSLMRACRHHVISNSTYSWWAAWLAGGAGQQVVAPRRWFMNDSIAAQDVVPARWTRM